jgi:hypothetical protein
MDLKNLFYSFVEDIKKGVVLKNHAFFFHEEYIGLPLEFFLEENSLQYFDELLLQLDVGVLEAPIVEHNGRVVFFRL